MCLGKAALTGECIKGAHNSGKYYLTSNSDEVKYYYKKAIDLLGKANPLMEIYLEEHRQLFNSFLISTSKLSGNRKRILSALPIHTITKNLLVKILKRNNLSKDEINEILNFVDNQKRIINTILKNNKLTDEIPEINKDDFEKEICTLLLSESFFGKQISYNYYEYLEHLKLTKEFAKNTPNYNLKINNNFAFKNIQISIHEQNLVIISKNINPTIHFVIKHPKLCNAIENFVAPIIEE